MTTTATAGGDDGAVGQSAQTTAREKAAGEEVGGVNGGAGGWTTKSRMPEAAERSRDLPLLLGGFWGGWLMVGGEGRLIGVALSRWTVYSP